MASRRITFNFNQPIVADSRSVAKENVMLADNGSIPIDGLRSDASVTDSESETSSNESSLMTIDMNDSPQKNDQSWMDSLYGSARSHKAPESH